MNGEDNDTQQPPPALALGDYRLRAINKDAYRGLTIHLLAQDLEAREQRSGMVYADVARVAPGLALGALIPHSSGGGSMIALKDDQPDDFLETPGSYRWSATAGYLVLQCSCGLYRAAANSLDAADRLGMHALQHGLAYRAAGEHHVAFVYWSASLRAA